MSKRVSFNAAKPKIEPLDEPAAADAAAGAFMRPLKPSLATLPWHLPLCLYSIVQNDALYQNTLLSLQQGYYSLAVLSFIYAVLLSESLKGQQGVKSSGPTGRQLLYIACLFPLTVLLALPLYGVMVLLGAPLDGHLNALSFYLACHVSLMGFLPLLIAYPLGGPHAKEQWWRLVTFQIPRWYTNAVYCGLLGAVWGAWLGVGPLPLDWDRDWQMWPITLVMGAYSGAFLGPLLAYAVTQVLNRLAVH